MYNLWEIASAVRNAHDALDDADRRLSHLWGEFPGEHDWPEMDAVHRKVVEAIKAVEAIMTPEFKALLADEKAEMDHLSDLADGASY